MSIELPYVQSVKNLYTLFEKIKTAKAPDSLTQSVLSQTFGLKSTSDRSFISLLKKLGFLDSSGKPTKEYLLLKNETTAKVALAKGIKDAYEPLFSADEKIHTLSNAEIKGTVSQITGADDSVVSKVATTFSTLVKLADFSSLNLSSNLAGNENFNVKNDEELSCEKNINKQIKGDFHFNIQIHLPSNATEESYINIFSALKKVF